VCHDNGNLVARLAFVRDGFISLERKINVWSLSVSLIDEFMTIILDI
jgi:hypothetical protein